MSLTLYFHPLSSFCHKALIALYENGTPFKGQFVDLMDPKAAAEFKSIWPIGKFPVLRDASRDALVPESSIIIEYLDQHYPGATRFLPGDPDFVRQTRFRDRFYDLHIMQPMQKIVIDTFRPTGQKDAFGVEDASRQIEVALGLVDRTMTNDRWAMGDAFTMADCAAAPSLFYADKISPLAGRYDNAARYLKRLRERPSFARVLQEAEPYLKLFPM